MGPAAASSRRVFTVGRNAGKLRGVMKSHSFIKPLPFVILLLSLTLLIAGCSEETGSGDQDSTAAAETKSPAETTAAPEQTVSEKPATGESTTEESRVQPPPPEETAGEAASSPEGGTEEVPALSGVEEATRVASERNEDAQFYSITGRPVTAEGRSAGWAYSFVSESAGELVTVGVTDGQAQIVNVAPQPPTVIQQVSSNVLPPVDQLVDSTGAVEQAAEFQSYMQQNPGARSSAGLDAASTGEPEWFLIVGEAGLQERVSATAQ